MEYEVSMDRVWVTVDATINTGNYENIKISMGESIAVQPGDAQKTRRDLANRLLKDLNKYIDKVRTD